jgi:CRP-like cAMP-binding protein
VSTLPVHESQAIQTALKQACVFTDATPEEVEALTEIAEWISLPAQTLILREGYPSDSIHILANGKLAVKEVISGDMELVIARMTPGDLVGELGFLESKGASASVRTDGPAQLVRLSYVRLKDVFHRHPALETRFFKELARVLAERVRKTNSHLRSALQGSAVTRV